MKVPKALTDIICYLRIAIFHLLGDNAITYAPFAERMKNEKEKIRLLNRKGIPSLPLTDIEVDSILVTGFVKGTNLKDVFHYGGISFEEKLKILAKSCERLKDIHAYFSHGDAQIRNILVAQDNETIWVDYEYIASPDVPILKQKARDLVFLIFSAAKHLGHPDKVVKAILNAYKKDEVKKVIYSLPVYQSIGYNLFLNFLNPIVCIKIRKALNGAR